MAKPGNYQKLDPTFKAQWLKDLRSGDFRQIKSNYITPHGYCCLGVAMCQFTPLRGIELLAADRAYQSLSMINSIPNDARCALIKMNDSGKTFHEIADWIEVNL